MTTRTLPPDKKNREEPSGLPDVAWIKKNVSVLEVRNALGLPIRQRRAPCWRMENHRNGDADPSLRFYERGNRVRCFVCDMRGGHSNIDLVMAVLGIEFVDAVNWIAERFPVPNGKHPGRPIGSRAEQTAPYRIGVNGSKLEVLVRSGVFGQLSPAERSILVCLEMFKDPDTGFTRISYRSLMRYAGVGRRANVANALKHLQRLHAIQITRGSRIGITRECSTYRITLEDPKFLALCNQVYGAVREQVTQEREARLELRVNRERASRRNILKAPRPLLMHQNRTEPREAQGTCEGLNLSSLAELKSNRPVPNRNREIGCSREIESLSDELWMIREWEAINRQVMERIN